MLFEFFQLIKCFFAIFCLKYGLVKAIFYGIMQCSERQKCHFRASNFKFYAGPRISLQSDFKLDPPLKSYKKAPPNSVQDIISKEKQIAEKRGLDNRIYRRTCQERCIHNLERS